MSRYWKSLGQYNWASNEKQWCVQLFTKYGNVSEIWDKDDEPDIDGCLPSEVLDLIEVRLDSYWISTRRDAEKAKIATIRENIKEVDREWIVAKIEATTKELRKWEIALKDCEEEADA